MYVWCAMIYPALVPHELLGRRGNTGRGFHLLTVPGGESIGPFIALSLGAELVLGESPVLWYVMSMMFL